MRRSGDTTPKCMCTSDEAMPNVDGWSETIHEADEEAFGEARKCVILCDLAPLQSGTCGQEPQRDALRIGCQYLRISHPQWLPQAAIIQTEWCQTLLNIA